MAMCIAIWWDELWNEKMNIHIIRGVTMKNKGPNNEECGDNMIWG